jgi:spermidine synthase
MRCDLVTDRYLRIEALISASDPFLFFMPYTKQCKISFLTNERFKSERKERVKREREREREKGNKHYKHYTAGFNGSFILTINEIQNMNWFLSVNMILKIPK